MSFDSSCGFLFYHLHYYGGCQYVKGTKQILITVRVVEFIGSHSNFLVCKLQLYTVNFTVLFCKCVYSFPVFFTKLFWQPQLPKLFCKNYGIFFTVHGTGCWQELGSHIIHRATVQYSLRPEKQPTVRKHHSARLICTSPISQLAPSSTQLCPQLLYSKWK